MTAEPDRDGIITFAIRIDDRAVPSSLGVESILVNKALNRIAEARIVVRDGDMAREDFEMSDSSTFAPGARISIEAGYDERNNLIFSGIILGQSIHIDSQNDSLLEIECCDMAMKMCVGRQTRSYLRQKDSDIVSGIVSGYTGLSVEAAATTRVWPEQVQYNASDWDFVVSLAEANGLVISTSNGTVCMFRPDMAAAPALAVTYGRSIIALEARLSAENQFGQVDSRSWDFEKQQFTSAQATPNQGGPGNLTTRKLSEVLDAPVVRSQTAATLERSDLENWSGGQMLRSELSRIRGKLSYPGSALAEPGALIELAGVGSRFNGKHLVSGVVHKIIDGNWTTEASLGLAPELHTAQPAVTSPPASGLVPAAGGLVTGIVMQVTGDPRSQYRILVHLPMVEPSGAGIWSRLAQSSASAGADSVLLPEVGDEVVVAFIDDNPRCPVILGSLYSSQKPGPFSRN